MAPVGIPLEFDLDDKTISAIGEEAGTTTDSESRILDISNTAMNALTIAGRMNKVPASFCAIALLFFSLGLKLEQIDYLTDSKLSDDEVFSTVLSNAMGVFHAYKNKGVTSDE